ncbi:hypothetical protein LCGC14_0983880 [marine sediment metagenome]|uniref:Uncharacterized protein n=1 Tax=marine sediment metagenome TaxID=412755 RepID=A0A0F9NU65_9ZZZZ
MSSTLDDFFGDGSEESVPECSFCGEAEGELIVGVQDAYGPTHWHHATCKAKDDATKGTPLTPTWDEAMEISIGGGIINRAEVRLKNLNIEGLVFVDTLDGFRAIRVEGKGEVIPSLPEEPVLVNYHLGEEWTAWYDNIEKIGK